MNLYVWPSHGGLESIDPESLTIITYAKIAQAPINIYSDVKPWFCPTYTLPFLRHSRNDSVGLKHIIPYFRKENYGVEYHLSDDDLTKLTILTLNIHQDLIPAIDYMMWCHKSNYHRVTCGLFGSAKGFPMNLIWSNILKAKASTKVHSSRLSFQAMSPVNLTDAMFRDTLYDAAKRCLTSLEYVLADREYFIANKPTYIDAVVYGYLRPVVSLGFECDALIHHVRGCSRIMELLDRIQTAYYPHRMVTVTASGQSDPVQAFDRRTVFGKTRGFVCDNWVPIRNSGVFVVMVSTMMVCYAKATKAVK